MTTRLTADTFWTLKRFFASKNSSPRQVSRNGQKTRVSQVEVGDAAKAAGVALDADRPVVVHAVLVQVDVRADVERQAAVRLQDDPELVVVEQLAPQAVAADLRAR